MMAGFEVRRVVAAGICAVVLAACGSSAAPTPASTASAAGSSPASEAPTAATSALPPTATASAAASVGDVSGAATALSNLTSYKVTVATIGGSNAGMATIIVIRQPAPAESFTSSFGGKAIRLVVIGATSWLDEGTGKFVKNAIPAAAALAMTGAFDPGTFLSSINTKGQLKVLQPVGAEQKNGVQTIHLHADQSTPIPAGQPTIPPGATIDIWVSADGGYLVALEAAGLSTGSGPSNGSEPSSFQLEVTNINDSSLTVTPPA